MIVASHGKSNIGEASSAATITLRGSNITGKNSLICMRPRLNFCSTGTLLVSTGQLKLWHSPLEFPLRKNISKNMIPHSGSTSGIKYFPGIIRVLSPCDTCRFLKRGPDFFPIFPSSICCAVKEKDRGISCAKIFAPFFILA